MRGIALVGTGRLATSLARTYAGRIVVVAGRDASRATAVGDIAGAFVCAIDIVATDTFDTLWLATSDSSLAEVVAEIAPSRDRWDDVVVVHSSGALGTAPLEPFASRGARVVALHPNISLRGDRVVPASTIWGVTPNDLATIETARMILGHDGARLLGVAEEHRALYHAAAATAANFSVTLFAMAQSMYRIAGVDTRDATELVAEFMRASVERSNDEGPAASMTGPIVRGDDSVVRAQQEAVRMQAPDVAEVFEAMIALTRRTFGS